MGSRLALPFLLLAALAASGLFWWLSSRAPEAPRGSVAETAAAETVADERPTAELARPDRLDTAPGPQARDRTVVSEAAPERGAHAHAAAAGGPTINGRIVDRDGYPVGGAIVLATNQRGFPLDFEDETTRWARRWKTTTDDDGRFVLEGPAAGELRIGARASGYAPYEDNDLTLPAGDEVELAPIVMSLGAILAGHVLDPAGRGIAGAELVRIGDDDRGGFLVMGGRREPVAVSEADGSFRIDQLACGPWTILVQTDEHPDRTFEGLAERPGEVVGGLEFVLEEGTSIAGRVTGVPDGEPALSVRASRVNSDGIFNPYRARKTEVDGSGRFTLRGLKLGANYDLRLRNAEREGAFGFNSRSRSESVRARAGDTGVVIPFQPEGAVLFQVVDAESRLPLTEFAVEAGTDWPAPLRDDDGKLRGFHPDGRVRVGNLRPASSDERVQLIVRATGYQEYSRDDIAVATGQEIDLGQILLEPVPILRITVLDAASGAPVSGAIVSLAEEQPANHVSFTRTIEIDEESGFSTHASLGGTTARTNEKGVAELTSLENKSCVVKVKSDDHAPAELAGLFLPRGQVVEETIELTPGGSVLVTAFDPAGEPLVGVRVDNRAPGQSRFSMFDFEPAGARDLTDSEGKVRFTNLQPGEHGFKLGKGGPAGGLFLEDGGDVHVSIAGDMPDDDGWTPVTVVEGETSQVTLHAAPVGELVGRVREAGLVLAGATLTLKEKQEAPDPGPRGMAMFGGDNGKSTRSDGDGEFGYRDVEEGTYTLTVSHPARRMSDEFVVEIEPGKNTFDVELPVSIIEGRMTDLAGEPLPGLTVRAERAQEDGPRAQFFAIRIESDGDDTVVSTGQELGDSTTTDQDGRYVLRGVQPDQDLVVTAEGDSVQTGQTEVLSVAPDETRRNVNLSLEPAGSLVVEAQFSDGAPARFCMLRANYVGDDDVQPEFSFIQSGTGRLTGLKPGIWKINVQRAGPGRADDDPGVDQEVEVKAGEEVETTVRLE